MGPGRTSFSGYPAGRTSSVALTSTVMAVRLEHAILCRHRPPEVRMTCQNGVEGIRTADGLLLLTHGELDAATADEYFTAITDVVENYCDTTPKPTSVVIDLCGVRFLSCAGVRMLLRLARWGARADVTLGVTVPDDGPVRRIVDVLDIGRSVPVVACPAPAAHGRAVRAPGCRSGGVAPRRRLAETRGAENAHSSRRPSEIRTRPPTSA
ncbi:STAS domain-containing protein [Nocardia sp. CDC186]|uniref:STAS domain-containing protein n=1 Tax=Nocardia implantans TaxID=3108168 RepID=A0ABU6AUC4_9NOCA|nr:MULTISPECIES: STAS domain-containing protein [unclassified Nocardia]MBF6191257.1 STAS domain-containing protein [Nocardia beijingensis]MEA3532901.1 STAS domain-containing protein [Nocardia sp. CDC192]MEB3510923.1 STAS domain-containing protein [Nocardia sp. CDC186]